MKGDISILIASDESPVLEFKRDFYWSDSTSSDDMGKKWGEFLKDLISLFNGYLGYVGKYRHLIFGVDEESKELSDINPTGIRVLSNLTSFKKNIDQRLDGLISPSYLFYTIEFVEVEGKRLLVFEISPPGYLVEIKKELQTKTRTLDSGAVLIRKGQNSDEVRLASMKECEVLNEELTTFRASKSYSYLISELNKEPVYKSIRNTIQLYMDKNSSYSFAEGYPIIKKDWKNDLIYEVYRLKDDFSKIVEFIYIHESSAQGRTFSDIKNNSYVKDISNSIVLIEKPKIKDIDKRKENLKKIFKTEYIYFIDEFGYEFLYKDCILPYEKFDLPVFVDSFYKDEVGNNSSALSRVKEWFESDNEPLFVISGHGGIGKTTIAKQFLDHVYDKNKYGVLFIDSKDIISELSRRFSSRNKICDVYDFYDALISSDDYDSSKFNRELLKLSIDNGSLVIALDGVDEVIAKLGDKFDVEQFIKSIYEEYSSELNKTKILITCRDHFWTDVRKNISIPEIKISAFNEFLVADFYAKKLNGDQKKIEKALEISNDFAIEEAVNEGDKNYIPFLVDIIARLVKSPEFTELNKKKLNSKFLSRDHNIDILISLICDREVVKLGTFSVDEQILFFMRMALEKNNGISVYDVKSILKEYRGSVDDLMIDNLKGHPLVEFVRDRFIFRYDAFDTYFKSLQLVNYFKLCDINKFSNAIVDISSGYLKYDSSFTRSVSEKIDHSSDLIIFFIENIEMAKEKGISHLENFISSIVTLCLDMLSIDNSRINNAETRTNLINEIFSANDNVIDGLCMVDFFGNRTMKPTLDFRDRTLINCYFNSYQYFWECYINQNTRFKKSFFNDIDPIDGINYDVHSELFSNDCDISNIAKIINEKEKESESFYDSIYAEVLKAFKIFYQRGNFYPRKQGEVRKKLATSSILSYMIDNDAILKYKDPGKPNMLQYCISKKYRNVIDLIEQNVPSEEFDSLVNTILQEV